MKKVICLLICFVTLFLVCFSASATTIQPDQTFTPTTTNMSGNRVQTGTYNCAGKKGYYTEIMISLSVTYMRYDVQNHTGIYSYGDYPHTKSCDPGKPTGGVSALVRPRDGRDSKMTVYVSGRTSKISVND